MTVALSGKEIAAKLEQQFPECIIESNDSSFLVKSDALFDIISYLKTNPEFEFNYLSDITAVDYFDYFDVVYHITSMVHNHSLVVKTRCYGRENLSVPSIVEVYHGANSQEREIYDLMGINFEGHPNMKRLFLWEGFQGHPLRKDYLEAPNG
ncbi:NAD(P)H-quinone oxidoreductase subunit J, chloroplastic [subsurface metagenome]